MTESIPPPHYTGHRERLRQKFWLARQSLSDYEILELFLFFVLPRCDTKPLAKKLLAQFETFENLAFAPPENLCSLPGVGQAVALALNLYGEMQIRQARQKIQEAPLLDSWERVVNYCRLKEGFQLCENVYALFLNSKNRLIADELVTKGTVDQSSFYIRDIVKRALDLQAYSFILVHNHPSGDATPSAADIDETRKLYQAAQVMGLTFHDHLIITHDRYTSLKNLGVI